MSGTGGRMRPTALPWLPGCACRGGWGTWRACDERALPEDAEAPVRPRPPRARGGGLGIAGPSAARGYTLIEVIVAFALLALALSLLLGTLSGAARQVRWADEAGRAALHAQSLLDQVGVGEALQPGHRDGSFEDGRYRWALEVAPYQDPLRPPPALFDPAAPRLLQLTLTVQWGEDSEDPRRRLRLQSLRLVTPAPTDAVPPL